MIAELDALSAERAEVPSWDGDTADDICKAQELYAKILGMLGYDLVPDIAAGLQSQWPATRQWVVIALEAHGDGGVPRPSRGAGSGDRRRRP